ncbi:hypothetical protein [Thauera phenylacetica]
MQPSLDRELLELDRIGVIGKHVEQLHHALDDLDRGLAFGAGGGFGLLGLHGGSGKDRGLAASGKGVSRMVLVRSNFA